MADPDPSPPDGVKGDGYAAAMELARKMIGLAKEQRDALARAAVSQFDWLVLRRQELTDQLPRQVAPGSVPPEPVQRELAALAAELAELDKEMAGLVKGRMNEIRAGQAAIRRTERALSGYLDRGPRPSTFVDRKR